MQRRLSTVIDDLDAQCRSYCSIASDADRSCLLKRMGMFYGVDQRLTHKQTDRSRFFRRDNSLPFEAAQNPCVLGFDERARCGIDNLTQIRAKFHRPTMALVHEQSMQARHSVYS